MDWKTKRPWTIVSCQWGICWWQIEKKDHTWATILNVFGLNVRPWFSTSWQVDHASHPLPFLFHLFKIILRISLDFCLLFEQIPRVNVKWPTKLFKPEERDFVLLFHLISFHLVFFLFKNLSNVHNKVVANHLKKSTQTQIRLCFTPHSKNNKNNKISVLEKDKKKKMFTFSYNNNNNNNSSGMK